MKLQHIILLFVLISLQLFSQEKVLKHVVQQGETITQIAIKYKTTPFNIFKLNPTAQQGIKSSMILLIPNSASVIAKSTEKVTEKTKENTTEKTIKKPLPSPFLSHVATTKETLYSLAVKHKTTVEAIEIANPSLVTNGLKIGDTIKIPTNQKIVTQKTEISTKVENTTKPQSESAIPKIIYHVVLPKETKFSIAKQFGITIEELEKTNPDIVESLKIGTNLKIVNAKKTTKPADSKPVITEEIKPKKSTERSPKEIVQVSETPEKPITNQIGKLTAYTILPKETLYSLSKKFALSIDELLTLNPSLSNGVKENDIIKVPKDVFIKTTETKVFANLSKSIKNQDPKKLILLLPFNINKIENDTVNSASNRIKTDKFLNMTLDFYSGAMMAIDSAKTLGVNLDIKILDSQETKASSNITSLIQNQNLANSDAIIGPFYQANVERAATLLADSKTFVISPLSKEKHNPNSKLLVANSDNESVKQAIFDFMKSKNGNILAVIDNKKLATKQFLKQKQPQTKLIPINDKNTFAADSLAQFCSKSQINYVILDSEKTGLILKTTAAMINLQKEYQMQLVILEKNETLDFDEVPLSRLVKLKMIYPSLTRENDSHDSKIFEKEFKKVNKVLPNIFATRGFDLTFDTILRLAQDRSFEQSINETNSEQIENKFEYSKNNQGGYNNKGIYILEYQSDLTIKELK